MPNGYNRSSKISGCRSKIEKWKERLQSVGYAQSSVEVKIGNNTGDISKCGETGEIMVRGDIVMPGYWNNRDATKNNYRRLVNDWRYRFDGRGWLRNLHDRSKDMIISGGSNIYPREVEEILLLHKSVSEVSVVGRKNDEVRKSWHLLSRKWT